MPKPIKHRSAGIVVMRALPGGWVVLVLRAYCNWDFPKGLLAAGETPLQAALEAKLAKARSLKQGMMQELLTGRIRLV